MLPVTSSRISSGVVSAAAVKPTGVSAGVSAHSIGHDDERRGLGLAIYIVQVGSEERVFLIVASAINLITGDFVVQIHLESVSLRRYGRL